MELVGVRECVAEIETDAVGVSERVAVGVCVAVRVRDTEGVDVRVAVEVREGVRVAVVEIVVVRVTDREVLNVRVAVWENGPWARAEAMSATHTTAKVKARMSRRGSERGREGGAMESHTHTGSERDGVYRFAVTMLHLPYPPAYQSLPALETDTRQ